MNIYILLISGFLLSAAMGSLLIPNILLISFKKKLFDIPDERKVHKIPVPRLGGLSFFPVILISLSLITGFRIYFGIEFQNIPLEQTLYEYLLLTAGCMMLYLLGVADDLVGVSYRYKFVVQIITAIMIAGSGDWINSLGGLFGIYEIPAWVGIPLTVFIIVYITNAINLIDGIDGLASGLSCIALVSLSVLFLIRQEYVYVLLSLVTLGVVIPFWFINVFGNAMRGHKLFMGDTGSLTLGYILSFLVIHLSRVEPPRNIMNNEDMIVAFSTLIVPLLDVIRVVLHRLRTGKNPFLPDKNHIHHKLQRTGMRIRMILLTILCLSISYIVLNAVLVNKINVTLLLGIDVVLWILLQLYINKKIKAKEIRNQK